MYLADSGLFHIERSGSLCEKWGRTHERKSKNLSGQKHLSMIAWDVRRP